MSGSCGGTVSADPLGAGKGGMSDSESPFWAAARGEIQPPPAARLLGWKVLRAEPGSGRIRVQFEATRDFTNPLGNIQGGFLAAMLDETLGPALATTFEAQEFAPTLELKVNFIRAVKPGTLIGAGQVVHRGHSVAFLQGELRNSEGELVATATATARLVRVEAGRFEL
jgi:uncharacterized protein (TIGR00369 family)